MSSDDTNKATLRVELTKEVNGIEMGVFSDGRAYLSGRGLGRICGSADGAMIVRHSSAWASGARDSKFAKFLAARQFDRPSLYIPAGNENAYPDDVCMLFLEYFAFEAQDRNGTALDNFKKFARAGLRLFIYGELGYSPQTEAAASWQNFQDRLMLNRFPVGFFSVFSELAQFVLTAIQGGLIVDWHTVPDISVGRCWSTHWSEHALEARFGARKKHPHRYPRSFPQSQANDQIEAYIYPDAALREFRAWMHTTYIPKKFPNYLEGKVKNRQMAPAAVRPILAAFQAPSEPQFPKKAS